MQHGKYNISIGEAQGLAIGDNAKVEVHHKNQTTNIETGGGAYIAGDVDMSGDFVGRDKVTHEHAISRLVDEQIRLDVAPPQSVDISHTFDIAVRISQPQSPTLAEEALTHVTSRTGHVYRQSGEKTVRYRISVKSADCTVHTTEQEIMLFADIDSETIYFQLTPMRLGTVSVVVSAYQPENLLAATTRIQVNVVTQINEAHPQINSALSKEGRSLDMLTPSRNILRQMLYSVLGANTFSIDELEDLCFRLDVDWDTLSGDNKGKKARALILHFERQGQLDHLRSTVLSMRPDLTSL